MRGVATPDQKVARQKAKIERLSKVARERRAAIQKAQKRLRWAISRRTVHRAKLKKARAAARRQPPKFEPWMLNGCPGNVTHEAKQAIARGVVNFKCVVTATTNGTHTPTSFHYPWNNRLHGYSDDLGHAVDFGGPLGTYDRFYAAEKKRGCPKYDELFGPGSGYCDDRTLHPGAAPDIPNHTHSAPVHVHKP